MQEGARELKIQSRRARRLQNSNRIGLLIVGLVVVVLGVAMAFGSTSLRQKTAEYEQRKEALEQQISEEEQRAKDLDEYEKYTKSKKFIEDMAKTKLGLVNPDEIILKGE